MEKRSDTKTDYLWTAHRDTMSTCAVHEILSTTIQLGIPVREDDAE